jgi:heme-degrading monooxygenase HmoA
MTPPLPWRASAPIDPAATYPVTITRLPLARHRRIPTIMRQTVRIIRALSRADGLVGYSLKADLIAKTFWTVSAWESEAALHAFARSDVHREAMRRVGPHMAEPQIEIRSVAGHELPLAWTDIRRAFDVPLTSV